jgi:hypothetical protein
VEDPSERAAAGGFASDRVEAIGSGGRIFRFGPPTAAVERRRKTPGLRLSQAVACCQYHENKAHGHACGEGSAQRRPWSSSHRKRSWRRPPSSRAWSGPTPNSAHYGCVQVICDAPGTHVAGAGHRAGSSCSEELCCWKSWQALPSTASYPLGQPQPWLRDCAPPLMAQATRRPPMLILVVKLPDFPNPTLLSQIRLLTALGFCLTLNHSKCRKGKRTCYVASRQVPLWLVQSP